MSSFDDLDLEAIERSLETGVSDSIADAEQTGKNGDHAENKDESCYDANAARGAHRKIKKAAEPDEAASMTFLDWVQCIMMALIAGVLVFLFLGRAINVEGSSMYPTLHDGDEVIISNLLYSPRQGDVIVLRTKTYSNTPLVKRVIAIAGQTVDIDFDKGIVYVDGEALDEPYVAELTRERESFSGPVTVPENCIFVLGDNRNHSTDSRYVNIGAVDRRCVLGRVMAVLIPSADEDGKRDWNRFGSIY